MSDTAHHSRLSPRAFVDLAHALSDGRPVAEAARIAGIDHDLAEWLMQSWAFMILLRIIPFFKFAPRNPASARPVAKVRRSPVRPAPVRHRLALWRQRQDPRSVEETADGENAADMQAVMTGALHALAEMAATADVSVHGRSAPSCAKAGTRISVESHRAWAGAFPFFSEKIA
ncbi:MAG: hypothetical protein R3C97_10655 [Geminicoccaceae bacterium]